MSDEREVRPSWPATVREALSILRSYVNGGHAPDRIEARFIAEVLEDATEDDLAESAAPSSRAKQHGHN